jgi:hypothetical protein
MLLILGPCPTRVGGRAYNVHVVGNQCYSSVAPEIYADDSPGIFGFQETSMIRVDDEDGALEWLQEIDDDRAEWWLSDPPRLTREKAELVLYGEEYRREQRLAAGLWSCERVHQEVPDRVPALYKNTSGNVCAL